MDNSLTKRDLTDALQSMTNALQSMETRLIDRIDRTAAATEIRLIDRIDRLAEATAGEVGTLHTQIEGVEKRLGARLESIDARMKLQAGLIQAGARAMARFSEFAENSEER
jgi:hypothetical protein